MGEKKQMGVILLFFLLLRFLVKAFLEYLGSWVSKPKYNLFLSKNFGPISEEIQKSDLEIIGKVPEDLNGQYVRNGPNPQMNLNGRPYHWFDGDGMLHGVEIMDGKASYINRWIRTDKWKAEKKMGKPLIHGIGELSTRVGFLKMVIIVLIERIKNKGKKVFGRDGGTANTALVYHDGRLLALVENCLPTHVKAPNFETVGVYDYDRKLNHNVTAHPKVDYETGELFFFGYSFQKPFLNYSYVSKEGKLINSFAIDKPNATMIHDFAVTKKYSIFPDLPLVFRMENILLDKPLIQFEPQTESRFGILPRTAKDQSEIKWFKSLPGYFFHSVNAWEEGEEVVLVACRSETIDLTFSTNEKGEYITKYPPKLYEWRFNLETGQTKEKLLLGGVLSEFPMINPRFAMRKNRFMYSVIFSTTSPESEGVLKYDYETGETIQLRFGRNKYGGEPYFVERKNSTDEDDGYLMTIVWDYSTKTTEFWIIDAKTMSASPIARIKLPQRVPYGFHGRWLSAEEIANQRKS